MVFILPSKVARASSTEYARWKGSTSTTQNYTRSIPDDSDEELRVDGIFLLYRSGKLKFLIYESLCILESDHLFVKCKNRSVFSPFKQRVYFLRLSNGIIRRIAVRVKLSLMRVEWYCKNSTKCVFKHILFICLFVSVTYIRDGARDVGYYISLLGK